ncbi:MAG: YceI family protein [Saprospiraceae bacterium]|nr:YceI family protein [Saprospiraceae bacterium]MCB9318452.1 YceI family protein [Lewinellaceae bacterium]
MAFWNAGIIVWLFIMTQQSTRYVLTSGTIYFRSDAPLEIIEAKSEMLEGVLDISTNSYAFSVRNSSFKGFNSPLQQEHFYENYMETDHYATSTFTGKILDPIDLTKEGEYIVRAKGILQIHGVNQERIIKSKLTVLTDRLIIRSQFTVPLEDHKITIPRIVYQKIAEEIQVTVEAEFKAQ